MPEDIKKVLPKINDKDRNLNDPIIYAHLFGVIGDWYITEISEDSTTVFGFRKICSEKEWEMESYIEDANAWGAFSIEELQNLVNHEFLKEKDIRFLIVRDLDWEPKNFSSIDLNKPTLNYPGEKLK
tara:strand:+ start:81 stop:461 length:381 start_codon:yes stop_codon:yes gene_type:complete